MVNLKRDFVFKFYIWFSNKLGPVLKQQQQDLLASKFLQQQSSVPQYAPVTSYNTNSSR
jgi:hypothetical protein